MTAVELLARLIAFPTVAGESNEALIDWTAERLADAGATVRVLPGPRPDGRSLHAVLGPADEPGVLLAAHTDVVAVEGQSWTSDPFTLRADGGRLYGRGAADMKGFIAAVLATAPAIRPRRPLHVALSVDEELGCRGTASLLAGLAGIAPPRWCVVGEPTGMRVVERHKGKLAFRVDVRGRPAHSSRPREGVNAVEHAARLIVALREVEDALTGATVSVGPIRGGVSLNIVPAACTFDAEVRLPPEQDPASALARVRALAARIAGESRIEVTELARYPGLASSGGADEVAALAGEGRGGAVDFGTEAGLYQEALGVPVVVCGPGDMAQAHVADEYLELEQLEAAERFIRRLGDSL